MRTGADGGGDLDQLFAARGKRADERVGVDVGSDGGQHRAGAGAEGGAIDETGAAIIKAVGIYQPGSFVRLATNEVAVVIQRGLNTTTPKVAVLLNRSGVPTIEPTIRDTSVRDHRIVASVAHKDVKVQLNLERLLPLTALPKSDRPW